MKLQSYIKKIDTKEVITCILLIVVGYMTAQLFMRKYNGFSVGGQCPTDIKCTQDNVCEKSASNICNKTYYTNKNNNKSYMCGYSNLGGGIHKCIGTTNSVNASCSKCNKTPSPPPPGGKTPQSPPPPPGGKTPPPPPSASGQCILGDYLSFSNDGCIYKGQTYEDYTGAPKGSCDCKNWYSPSKISFTLIIAFLVIIFIGFPAFLFTR